AGFSAEEMKNGGYSDGELLGAGFDEPTIDRAGGIPGSMTADDIRKAGCNADNLNRLRAQGVTAAAIVKISGCSVSQLKAAGFTAAELKAAGFTAAELKAAGFTAADLKAAGFDAQSLLDAGFTPADLAAAGFAPEEVSKALAAQLKQAGCSVAVLQQERLAGVSASALHKATQCTAAQLLAAGFSKEELAAAGFTPAEIAALAGIPGSSLSDDAVKKAGCDVAALTQLRKAGVTASRIHALNGCTAEALRAAGFTAAEVAAAGFSPAQLLAAGFTPEELRQAGLLPGAVIASLKSSHCSVESLKAARTLHVASDMIRETAGCSLDALKAAGYTAAELKGMGFTAAQLKAAGFSAADLKAAGFSAKELKTAGFSAAELKAAGFSAAELKAAGFSAAELKAAGFSAAELKAAGFSAAELKAAGFSASELKAAGFSAKQLLDAGFSPAELSKAGFSVDELRAAGVSDVALRAAGLIPPDASANDNSLLPTVGLPGQSSASAKTKNQLDNQAKQLKQLMTSQQKQMLDQRALADIKQRTGLMMGAAKQAVGEWKKAPKQVFVATAQKDTKASPSRGAGESSLRERSGQNANQGETGVKIKAGDILFAVIDTAVNTDEPGPILATIVSGQLKGSKLIGSFVLAADADKMVINFKTISMINADHTQTINAFAIDPDTARTALSSETNHHYLSRYGALFASSFMEGFSSAIQSSNTTVQVGGTGGVTNTTVSTLSRSALDNALIGLGQVGKDWSQTAQKNMNRPTTVQVYSGTGVGVLFTQDASL
ncbi:MAG: type IV secretion protein IcmE, partial [Legionella sp. 21-45-4]